MPKSDLQILLCLTLDDFTRQRETPWGRKGLINQNVTDIDVVIGFIICMYACLHEQLHLLCII